MNHLDIFHNLFLAPQNAGGLFSRKEVELAATVYPAIVDEIGNIYPRFESIDSEFDLKYETTRENFELIIESFRKAIAARTEYLKHFCSWKKSRKENIKNLRESAGKIHLDRKNSNISRLVSGSVGIVSGSAVAASIAFPPLLPFLAVGAGVSVLSGATLLGTSVTEHVLLNKEIKKAQKVLQKDEEDFKVMRKWFEHSQDVLVAIAKVLGLNVSLIKWSDFSKILKGFKSSSFSELRDKAMLFTKALASLVRKSIKLVPGIFLPTIITFLFVMVLTHKQNKFIFDCVLMTQRLALGLLSGLDVTVEIGRVIATTALKGTAYGAEMLTKSTARAVALGAFAGIGIAFDITTIVLTSIDVHKGSFSEHGTEIMNAATKFNDELEFLEDVYNELNQM